MANIFDGLTKVFAGVITSVAETPCRFLIRSQEQTFNPATATYENDTTADSGPLVCTPPEMYEIKDVDDTRIKQGDFKILLGFDQWENLSDVFGEKPSADLIVQIETEQHKIGDRFREYVVVSVKPLETGSKVVVWEVQCRG